MNLVSSQSAVRAATGNGVVVSGGALGVVLISLLVEILIVLGLGLGGRRT